MKKPNLLFLGVFAVFAFAFWGMVLAPQAQLAALQPQVDEDTGEAYPVDMGGAQAAGREIYIANGCQTCHSQEVRSAHSGPDIERGWGKRRTVPLDYLYDRPAVLSQSRIGPDLANLGARKNAAGQPQFTAQGLYRHLYFPRYDVADSVMPPYRYLFEKRKISGERAVDALDVQVAEGYQIVPTEKARTLVAYLLSLDRTHELKNPAAPAAAAPATK